MDQYSLDYLGILAGTDKTSLANDYLRHYERVLQPLRNEPIQLLEIGIAAGASLQTWEQFFPQATIIGVDLNDGCRVYAGGRKIVEIGSQGDPQFLSQLAQKYKPSVIIDDGSHLSAHVFLTFEHLFPSLLPGGIYIMEDLYLHYGDTGRNTHSQGGATPAEHMAAIAHRLTAQYFEPGCDETIRQLAKTIDSIEFIPRATVIRKRGQEDVQKRLDYLFEAAQKADQSLTWYHLSAVLLSNQDLERAEIAAQRAVTLAPHHVAYWPRLADAQTRLGKVAEAIETLREGVRRDPGNATVKGTLVSLEERLAAAR